VVNVGVETAGGGGGAADFLYLPRLALGPTQPPVKWAPGLFPGLKLLVHGVDHLPPSSIQVKQRAQPSSTPLGLYGLF